MLTTPTTPKHVFVTGASSGAGLAVVRHLAAAGHKVTGTVSSSRDAEMLRKLGAIPAYPDLMRDGEIRSAIQGGSATIVVHCAPLAPNHVPQIKTDWESYESLLRDGTTALMNGAKAAGVEFVVVGSYAFVYGDQHGHAADETTEPPRASTPFVRGALAAEQAALAADVPACVLRAGYLYGASSPETVELHDRLKIRAPLASFDGHAVANWLHVEDFARAVALCIEQQPAGETFNIVDNHPATSADFLNYFVTSLNLTAPGNPPTFLAGRYTGKTQAELLNASVKASNAKAAERLGWKPMYGSYREGIDQTQLVLRAEEPVR